MTTTSSKITSRKIALRVRYNPTGETLVWRFWREPRMYSTVHKGAQPSWCWIDSDGYQRCGPETWAMFVPYLRSYFESYNVTPLQDFS